MNRTALAVAASLAFTPAHAAPCDIVPQDLPWKIFTVHQVADTVHGKFCLSFTSNDPRVNGVLISVKPDENTPAVIGKEGCLDIRGAATQILIPTVYASDGDSIPLQPLGMEQAKEVFESLSQACIASHPTSYTPIKFTAPSL